MASQDQEAVNLYKRALKKHISPKPDGSLILTDLDSKGEKIHHSSEKIHKSKDQVSNPYHQTLKRHISRDERGAVRESKIKYDPTISNILIIGGSSGIGLEIVKQLQNTFKVKDGKYRLYITGFPDDILNIDSNTNKNHKIVYKPIDLTQSDYINTFDSWLFRGLKLPNLDLVIYCAGIGYVGDFTKQQSQNIKDMIQINYTAPVQLTKLFLPYLQKGSFPTASSLWSGMEVDEENINGTIQKGKMIYLGSPSTLYPTPHYMVYSATKAALQQFAVNLRYECNRFGEDNGIDVALINPPPTKTEFHKSSGFKGDRTKFWKVQDTAKAILDNIFYNDQFIKIWMYNVGAFYIGVLFVFLSILSRIFEYFFDLIFRIIKYEKRGKGISSVKKSNNDNEDAFKHLIITGGSKGLGSSITHWFACDKQPWNIVNISRTESKFTGTNIEYDLGDKQLYDLEPIQITERIKDCDVMINNAALNISGKFIDLSMDQIDRMIQLNFVIPILMVHDVLNKFKDKKIVFVFIASLSNYVYYPYSSVYGSTKIGLTNFARSLGIELFSKKKYHGSDVLIVCPGPINTEMARSNSPDPEKRAKSWLDPVMVSRLIYTRIKQRYLGNDYVRCCGCINLIYRCMFNRIMIIGWKEYFISWLACLFPTILVPIMSVVFKKS